MEGSEAGILSARRRRVGELVRLISEIVVASVTVVAGIVFTVLGVGSLLPTSLLAVLAGALLVFRRRVGWTVLVAAGLCLAVIVWRSSLTPRNDRDWMDETSVIPTVTIDGDTLVIEGFRDFTWHADGSYDAAWETRRFPLADFRRIDMILEPFEGSSLMAHTMLSFDFGPSGRLLLSIEARKEKGEAYDPILGGLNNFELLYIFMSEQDAFSVRAHAGHEFYAFPIRWDPVQAHGFLLTLCATSNHLHKQPRFYHIIKHNCTTAWIEAADSMTADPLGLRVGTVLNGRIGRLLFRRNAIDTDLPYEEAKARFRVDQRVLEFIDDPEFSERIRAAIP